LEEIIAGALYLVSTPIGNLADISHRAIFVLKTVDIIAAEGPRTSKFLLNKYAINTNTIAYYSYNQQKQTPYLISLLSSDKSIALISDAGTPGISDPAYKLVQQCKIENIRVIPIPGASALLAALVSSGLPTNKFVFEGFLPLKKGRKTRIAMLAEEERTIVIYESPHRFLKTIKELSENWGERHCAIAREITKIFEEIFNGNFSQILDHFGEKKPRGEFVIVIEGKKNRRSEKSQRQTM
jgi:16S rRNA (cytidine1402-2'-O)-methyltransferase